MAVHDHLVVHLRQILVRCLPTLVQKTVVEELLSFLEFFLVRIERGQVRHGIERKWRAFDILSL